MKSFLTILLLAVATVLAARAELPAGWGTNYNAAISAATAAQRPALLYFTASWCGPCKLMSRITLTDPAIVQTLSAVECVALDIDEHPDLAAKYNISGVPTLILLSTGELELKRTVGGQTPVDFMPWLTNSLAEVKEALVHQVLAKKNLAEVDELLASTGTNALKLAAAKLFDLCDERDPVVAQAAAGRLKTVADRDPSALLEGLNDPRLASRIQVANALRTKIGDGFDVDPWSDAATRKIKIIRWRETLTQTPNTKTSP